MNNNDFDLNLEVEAASGHVDAAKINSAGDFVDYVINDEINELPQAAIDNTEAFINRLINLDLPMTPKKETKINFAAKQKAKGICFSRFVFTKHTKVKKNKQNNNCQKFKSHFYQARHETIRDKMTKRKEESRIRIEAQKAARIEERARYDEQKRRDQIKREKEEKEVEREIERMRKQLDRQRVEMGQAKKKTRKEVIRQVHLGEWG